ncbi:pancreatic lipase-related protein 2-like [Anoplophora glabripennis]|uniref:pancreatic lipase-related protein 2-like n=1 Tax=Anoplophora glabripennis TaxID=217634 RepID=UPI0008741E22|nr:pancreatic lipase-related protein 2-like [Anoplophora glabripennis]
MKLILLFVCLFGYSFRESESSQRNYVAEEENKYRMSYFLVETDDGGYEMQDLTVPSLEVTASLTDVVYYFCSKSSRNGTLVNNITSSLSVETFDPTKEVLVLIHGWRSNYVSSFNSYVKSAALDKFDLNVIIVDWSKVSYTDYIVARDTVPDIGKFVGEFIQSLSSTHNIPLSKISIVGHSLGAHVSGIAGKTLGGKVGTIIGLDPAAPLISISDKDYCLDSSDAKYVQVIHTNTAFYGISTSLGHSDYYPNGGKKQPGCDDGDMSNCSHGRAYKFYAESIRRNKFVSQQCDSYSDFTQGICNGQYSLMGGYNIDKEVTGDYYLDTNENYPYAIESD